MQFRRRLHDEDLGRIENKPGSEDDDWSVDSD
jgi:hypothetical protein